MANVPAYHRNPPVAHPAWKAAVDHFQLEPNTSIKGPTVNGDHAHNGYHNVRPPKRRRLDDIISVDPANFAKALRVEVLKISSRENLAFNTDSLVDNFLDVSRASAPRESPLLKARCKLTISHWMKTGKTPRVLYCTSQICSVKVFTGVDHSSRMARIYLDSPFYVPADMLFVEREDGSGFRLDDQYLITTELESAGESPWPPPGLLLARESQDLPQRQLKYWTFSSTEVYRLGNNRLSAPVHLKEYSNGERLAKLNLDLDLDMRWSTPHAVMAKSPPSSDIHMDKLANDTAVGQVEEEMDLDTGDDLDEEPTPSRSLRARDKRDYNMKLLSDRARGKERKAQNRRRLIDSLNETQVTWTLPQTGDCKLDNFGCLRCWTTHDSIDQLKVHMTQKHSEFECRFDQPAGPKAGYHVQVMKPGEELRQVSSRNPPSEKQLTADDASSDSEDELSPSKPSRNALGPRLAQPASPESPQNKSQLIPNNGQPMYDRLTKAVLEPGTRVIPPKVDDSWMMKKHYDAIQDYSDLSPEEKEYMWVWDTLIMKERVTSIPHLQEVYIRFVERRASWLLSNPDLMTEFAKHLAVLKARSALSEETVLAALDIIRKMRMRYPNEPPEPPKVLAEPAPRKSKSGCGVCGQQVRGPARLVCINSACKQPFYHGHCVRRVSKGRIDSENWRCSPCCKNESNSS